MTTKQEVIRLHKTNPTWCASDIAKHLMCSDAYIRATARRNNLQLPRARGPAGSGVKSFRERLMDENKQLRMALCGASYAASSLKASDQDWFRNGWRGGPNGPCNDVQADAYDKGRQARMLLEPRLETASDKWCDKYL